MALVVHAVAPTRAGSLQLTMTNNSAIDATVTGWTIRIPDGAPGTQDTRLSSEVPCLRCFCIAPANNEA